MTASIPFNASGSLFSSFFNCTVRANPANFAGNRGRIRWERYIRWPEIFSSASETDATSTWRKPSRTEASFGGVDCVENGRAGRDTAVKRKPKNEARREDFRAIRRALRRRTESDISPSSCCGDVRTLHRFSGSRYPLSNFIKLQ